MQAITPWGQSTFKRRKTTNDRLRLLPGCSPHPSGITQPSRRNLDKSTTVIGSDCQPLQWLFTFKTLSGRLARWAIRMQGMNLSFRLRSGQAERGGGYLVHGSFETTQQLRPAAFVSLPSIYIHSVTRRFGYQADSEYYEKHRGGEIPTLVGTQFFRCKCVPSYHVDCSDRKDPQLVVLIQCQNFVMQQYHNAATAGHCGFDRTFRTLADRFYFLVQDYVQKCISCQCF